MMQHRKSKKILIYFSLLLIVGSINNININGLKLQSIKNINIIGLDIKNKKILLKKIKDFNINNIFSISKSDLINEIKQNSLVEEYSIFKRYPSSIDINIKKTKFLAKTNQDGKIYFLGSNGKFTRAGNFNNQLPFIFGNPEVIDFFNIKKIIDKSKISYSNIKNFYFFSSKRWDLELRDNTVIKLPNDDTHHALNLALEFLNNENFKNKIIDARIKNQIILND